MQHCCTNKNFLLILATLLHYLISYNQSDSFMKKQIRKQGSHKRLKNFILFGFCLGVLTACHKEKGEIDIVISPSDNTVVSNAASVEIVVNLSTTGEELEESTIVLRTDSTGSSAIPPFPLAVHEHVKSKSIRETVNLSAYPSGTHFIIEVASCTDHNCSDKVSATAHFSIP